MTDFCRTSLKIRYSRRWLHLCVPQRQRVLPKRRHLSTRLHGVTSYDTVIIISPFQNIYMVKSYSVCPGWRVLHGTGSTTWEALSGQAGITNETSASFQHAGYQRNEACLPCPASIQALYTDVTSSHTDEGKNVLTLTRTEALILIISLYHPPTHPTRIDSPSVLHNHTHHSDIPHSVGLLWTSDQPDAETSSFFFSLSYSRYHPVFGD